MVKLGLTRRVSATNGFAFVHLAQKRIRGGEVCVNPVVIIAEVERLFIFDERGFGTTGANLDVAYVTSMARPMNGQYHREREAGCLFAVHGLGVRGLPEPRFAG